MVEDVLGATSGAITGMNAEAVEYMCMYASLEMRRVATQHTHTHVRTTFSPTSL